MAAKKETADAGQAEVQQRVDEEQAQGYRPPDAEPVDPTPNEHYTVSGVIAGKPTPETDPAHADDVNKTLVDRARNV